MARRKEILPDDVTAVVAYIDRRFGTDLAFPSKESQVDANHSFAHLDKTPEKILAWCENWLSNDQWHQLRNAVRASRKRRRDRYQDRSPVTITLSRRAWEYLSLLARRDDLTLSEYLERTLAEAYRKAR